MVQAIFSEAVELRFTSEVLNLARTTKRFLSFENLENHLMASHEVRNNFTLLMRDRTKKYHKDYFISRALNRKVKKTKSLSQVYRRYTHGTLRCLGTSTTT